MKRGSFMKTPKARKMVSLRMKAYWARRRRVKAEEDGERQAAQLHRERSERASRAMKAYWVRRRQRKAQLNEQAILNAFVPQPPPAPIMMPEKLSQPGQWRVRTLSQCPEGDGLLRMTRSTIMSLGELVDLMARDEVREIIGVKE